MKSDRTTLLLLPVLLALSAFPPVACATDDVLEQINSSYGGKILTLRHFYEGEHLAFRADGSLVTPAEVGPWTVDAQIAVKSIQLRDRALDIRARRVCVIFDRKGKRYRDVLKWLAETDPKDERGLQQYFRENEVEVEIQFPSGPPDSYEIAAAMDTIFLKPGELIGDVVPDSWREYFDKIEGQSRSVPSTDETVYRVKPGEVSVPRQIYAPEPEFSEEARLAKFQGSLTLAVIVDSSGNTRDIRVVSPLGLGLDEKAIEAVGAWKFEPAVKDARPVAVPVEVEFEFHLN